MSCVTRDLNKKGFLKECPSFVPFSIEYETIMGSQAYGVSSESSDTDIYGFCTPDIELLFPQLTGEIEGFGTKSTRFLQHQQQKVIDGPKEYDITIFSIVRYFQLLMENNPNVVDSIYTPDSCVTSISPIGKIVRENRDLFLHKGSYHKFKGYAYSQVNKLESKKPEPGSKRALGITRVGYDSKYAYHIVRLISEVEQILITGTINIQKDAEVLKEVRAGEWSLEQVKNYFTNKESYLEDLYKSSTLRDRPYETGIYDLLVQCLELFYGMDALKATGIFGL